MATDQKNPFDFSQLLPGFNFLSGAPGAALSSGPLGHWIAPTVDTEELDRRINELKTVQYWLEQNQLGIKATIQAMEVQKMTLATLRGMNLNVAEVAKAFTLPTGEAKADKASAAATTGDSTAGEKPLLDPVQWWGALTQQFQEIATQTMQEATRAAQNAGAEVAAMAKAAKAGAEAQTKAPAAAPTPAAKAAAPAAAPKKAASKPQAARAGSKSGPRGGAK